MTEILNSLYTGFYYVGWMLGVGGGIGVVATLLRLLILYSKRSYTVNAKRHFWVAAMFFGFMLIGNALSDKGEAWLSDKEQKQEQEQEQETYDPDWNV